MRIFFIVLLLATFQNLSRAQNLIPDGSFESTTNLDYEYPFNAFGYLDYWYPANLIGHDSFHVGTPDLFDYNNLLPPMEPLTFWNNAFRAADGDFHVGIVNTTRLEGYLTPEAIGTSLTEPLEANEFYHIELQVRNKGVLGGQNDPILCVQGDYKAIEILLDPDSVFVIIDEFYKDSYHEAAKKITIGSTLLEYHTVGIWNKFGTCFQADGGEQFLAVTMPTGRFNVDPPCMVYDFHWDVFHAYYFDIDAVQLTKLPKEVSLSQTICKGRPTKVNIAEMAKLPIMQNEIEYHWEDGRIDSINYVSEAGTYLINAVIDCKTIPIILEVTDIKCDPNVFIPNAFSPNGDGYNDQLEIFIVVDLPITNYQFSVFNRWGAKVFSTTDSGSAWDGTFQGDIMDNGVYIWLLEYTIDDVELGVINYKESGEVTMLR